jgi:hypothetical protein
VGTVEVLPDLLVKENNTSGRTLGGGAGSVLAALNDASDSTFITAAGTLAQSWEGWFRFAQPSIPAGAVITHAQLRIRYSHNTSATPGHERFHPVTVLVGRQSGSNHLYDMFTPGEVFVNYSLLTSVQQATFPLRNKDWSGKFFLGERYHMLMGRRLYGTLKVSRRIANNQARVYSFSLVLTYDEKPVVNLLNPSGSIPVARPPVDWTHEDPEARPQDGFDLRIYTQADATHAAFDLDDLALWPPLYRRVERTPATHHDLVSGFGVNGGAYRIFVRNKTLDNWARLVYVNSAGVTLASHSDWDFSDFTLSLAAPRAPLVMATYDSTKHGIVVEVKGLDNMLDWTDASFEDGVAGWTAGASTSIVQTSAQALHGTDSMQITRNTSIGDAIASGPTSGVPVLANETYTATAWFRANTTSRTTRAIIVFFDNLGNLVGASSTTYDFTDVNTGWRQVLAWGTAPSIAVSAIIVLTVVGAAAGEVHYVDQVGLFPGIRNQLLTENQADLESGTTGWAAGASTSIAQSTAQSYRNSASLQLTRNTSTGTASATTPTGTSGVPVKATTQYTAAARFRANTAGRSTRVLIGWYTAAGALISTDTGSSISDTTTGWVQATVTATSPGTAAFAAVVLEVLSAVATEVHFADTIILGHGPVAGEIHAWNQGGFLHDDPEMHVIELQRSLGLNEHGMEMWETVPEPRVIHLPRHQMLTFVDYEVPALATVSYRAKVEAPNMDGDVMNSPWSKTVTASMVAFDSWWLRDPLDVDHGLSMRIRVVSCSLTTPKPNTTDYPAGSTAAVMTHDGVKKDNPEIVLDLLDEATYTKFRAMVDSGATLLLQDVFGRQWYVQPNDGVTYDIHRAVKQIGEPYPVRHAHRVTVPFVSVERPRALGVAHHA